MKKNLKEERSSPLKKHTLFAVMYCSFQICLGALRLSTSIFPSPSGQGAPPDGLQTPPRRPMSFSAISEGRTFDGPTYGSKVPFL